MSEYRIRRVEETIKNALAEIIQREIKDPRLGFITISDVHVSKDLRSATVYVSVLHTKDKSDDSVEILQSARFLLRKHLKGKIVTKYIPDLTFKQDNSLDHAFRVEELIKKIHSEDNVEKPSGEN